MTRPDSRQRCPRKSDRLLEFSIITYRDNSIEQTFPRSVAAQFLKKPVSLVNKELHNESATDFEKRLFVELQRVAKTLRRSTFQDGKKGNLFWLSEHLKTTADSIEKKMTLGPEFREVFYGAILALLAPPQTQIEFEFASLPLVPSYWDFFYLSIIIGTGNIPSEITPLAPIARVSVWFQLVFSYLMLGVFIGVIANIVGDHFRQRVCVSETRKDFPRRVKGTGREKRTGSALE